MKKWIQQLGTRLGIRIEKDWIVSDRRYLLQPSYLELVYSLLRAKPDATIAVIGANDGQQADPLCDVLHGSSLCPILVEPNPTAFARLSEFYAGQDTHLIQAAISNQSGELKLYVPRDDYAERAEELGCHPHINSLWGSLDPDNLLKCMRYEGDWREVATTIQVPVITPQEMMQRAGVTELDLLQIDAEGHDWVILQAFLDAGIQPPLICFERTEIGSQVEEALHRLVELGYHWASDNLNIFAVQTAWSEEHRS